MLYGKILLNVSRGDNLAQTITRRGLQLINYSEKVMITSKLNSMIFFLDTCNTDYLVGALICKYLLKDFTSYIIF